MFIVASKWRFKSSEQTLISRFYSPVAQWLPEAAVLLSPGPGGTMWPPRLTLWFACSRCYNCALQILCIWLKHVCKVCRLSLQARFLKCISIATYTDSKGKCFERLRTPEQPKLHPPAAAPPVCSSARLRMLSARCHRSHSRNPVGKLSNLFIF